MTVSEQGVGKFIGNYLTPSVAVATTSDAPADRIPVHLLISEIGQMQVNIQRIARGR